MGERIIPYNRNELLLGVNVEKSIIIINEADEKNVTLFEKENISDLINIKAYLDDEYILDHIERETKQKKNQILEILNRIINDWLNNNIEKMLKKYNYRIDDALWREVNQQITLLERINKDDYLDSLFSKDIDLNTCIKYKNVVKCFNDEIGKYLNQNIAECIDILLKKYEMNEDAYRNNELYIPTSINPFSEQGHVNIASIVGEFINDTLINDYSKMEQMRLLSISENLKLNKELKFLAKKKYEELNNNYFKEHQGHSVGYSVTTSPRIEFKEFDEKEMALILSEKWVKEHDDYKIRFIFNTSTFLELMNKGRMNLDSLISQSSFMDSLFTKGKKEYPMNNYASMLDIHILSLMIYEKMLVDNGVALESLLAKYYNEYIVNEFGYDSFCYVYDDSEMSYRSKAILILPLFDLTLRKIEYFLKHKCLNLEYIDFDEDTVNYRTIKSSQKIKNVYINPDSKVSPFIYLHYQPNYLNINDEFLSVYEAVKQTKVVYSELDSQNKRIIEAFIEMSCLILNDYDEVVFSNNSKAEIYKFLFVDGEIVYYDYDKNIREIIDEEIQNGLLISDNNFLSRRECDRYSYIMDLKQYSNSLNIRNSYSHKGAVNYDDSVMRHQYNYYTILMLFIQVTLKFNFELCLIADLEVVHK